MFKKIDHLVITVRDILKAQTFYEKLGFSFEERDGRYALHAGDFKINVHILGQELSPHAKHVQVGSSDICFEISGTIDTFKTELEAHGIAIELGIVKRKGTRGPMRSLYVRDPDGNLLEFCSYL